MAFSSSFGGITRALRNRQFRIYTLGSIPSQLGTWMQRLAVGWLTWQLTESETWLGIIAFVDMFPVVIIGPIAGALADRIDRLAFARAIQIVTMAQAAALAVLTITGAITIEILFALTLFLGIVQASFQPFRQAIVANLVHGDELAPAIAVNSVMWHSSRVVGPAIAGAVIVTWGIGPAIAINAATYVIFIIALYRIHLPAPAAARRSIADIPAEIVEGIRYAVGHPVIGPLLFILLCASTLGRPVTELLPGFAAEVFGRGAGGLAWLTSAAGLGAVLAGLWLARRGRLSGLVGIIIASVLVLALALIAFAATDWFWFAVPAMVAVGFGLVASGVTVQTMIQSTVDEGLRGRVLSLYGMVWLGCPALGAIVMGGLSEIYGLRWPVIGAGVLCLMVWLWALFRHASIRAVAEGGEA